MSRAGLSPPLPRALIVLLGAAAVVIVIAGARAAAWLIGPVFLALVVVLTVHPIHERIRRLGLPSWVATAGLVLLIYAALLGFIGLLVVSVARLATILPLYAGRFDTLLSSGGAALGRLGVGPDQLREVFSSLNYGRLAALLAAVLLSIGSLAGNLVFLLSLLLFLSIESTGIDSRMAVIAEDHAPLAAALREFAYGTRRYVAVTTVIGLITGAVDGVALAVLGVPLAVLWGLLAFITNFLPYIGFFIGLAPPALLALLIGGWRLCVIVVVIYIVANFVLTSLIQPRYVGNAVGFSVTVVLVALVLWGWLLGTLGAVLAIPLTLLARVLLVDVDPQARWVNALLGSRASLTPPRTLEPGLSDGGKRQGSPLDGAPDQPEVDLDPNQQGEVAHPEPGEKDHHGA